jgi:hypothetical protein
MSKNLALGLSVIFCISLGSNGWAQLKPIEEGATPISSIPSRLQDRMAIIVNSLSVGQTGILRASDGPICPLSAANLEVISVVDKKNAVVRYEKRVSNYDIVAQRPRPSDVTYTYLWLKGFSTEGITDGKKITIDYVVSVTGTKSYKDIENGKTTILLVEPQIKTKEELRDEELAAKQARKKEKDQAKAEQDREDAAEKARWHTWTYRGKKFDARFSGKMGETVILTKDDGTKLKISLDKLSQEDQEWIKEAKWKLTNK